MYFYYAPFHLPKMGADFPRQISAKANERLAQNTFNFKPIKKKLPDLKHTSVILTKDY